MSILITGGAGFIGSHTAKLLHSTGSQVVVLDNLSTGRRASARWGTFVEGRISDSALLRQTIRDHSVTAVIHLAASCQVGESMAHPGMYFANNVCGTFSLLDAMVAEGVLQLVFASSCSIYGNAVSSSAREDDAATPVSPYGESKLVTERALPWYQRAYGLSWVALRYFNAAGAEEGLGEDLSRSVRIIPRAVYSAVGGGPPLQVFGTTFPTVDGSAVRDYVHVSDIADANRRALGWVEQACQRAVINIGSGSGVSVLQIIETVGKQTGREVPVVSHPMRPGDPAFAVSDASRARELLGWTPAASDLTSIVASVLRSR